MGFGNDYRDMTDSEDDVEIEEPKKAAVEDCDCDCDATVIIVDDSQESITSTVAKELEKPMEEEEELMPNSFAAVMRRKKKQLGS